MMLYTLYAAPLALAKVWMLGEVCPSEKAPMSTEKKTFFLKKKRKRKSALVLATAKTSKSHACLLYKLTGDKSTHSEYGSNRVLFTQDECTAIPEGQSIGQVNKEEGDTHGKVSRDRLLYSHPLSIL